ncbi:MAG: hypothetical protein J6V14_05385 [Clostridia bacterium]|nr:hypothetical protein [Clostridia bacterium]
MKKKLFAIALALVLLATMAACDVIDNVINGGSKTPAIVGKWTEVRDDDTDNIFRFDADGTGDVRTKVNGETIADIEFIWKLDGNQLKLWLTEDGEPNGTNFHFKYEITESEDGDKLELFGDETGVSTVYKRQK